MWAVDPECGLVSLDQPVQVGGERRVQRIVLVPPPDRAPARRVVGDHHRSFVGKLRPRKLSFDEVPGDPMPLDGLPRAEVPPMVSNRAREIRYAPAQPPVRPTLVGLAVELQIRPQGRPNEASALDPDRAGVEEVDPDFRAFVGEPYPRVVDLRAVELVVTEDVDYVRGRSPELRELRHESRRVGREVAGEDDDIGLGLVLGHQPTMLDFLRQMAPNRSLLSWLWADESTCDPLRAPSMLLCYALRSNEWVRIAMGDTVLPSARSLVSRK